MPPPVKGSHPSVPFKTPFPLVTLALHIMFKFMCINWRFIVNEKLIKVSNFVSILACQVSNGEVLDPNTKFMMHPKRVENIPPDI